jgi:hypothetical protein
MFWLLSKVSFHLPQESLLIPFRTHCSYEKGKIPRNVLMFGIGLLNTQLSR